MAVEEDLKVMIEFWTLHRPIFDKLTFNSELGYRWVIPSATEVYIE